MKAVVALVGAFSVITNLRMELFQALDITLRDITRRDVTYPTGEVVVSSPNLPPAMVMSPRLNVLAKINSEGNSSTQPRPHSPLLLLLEKDIICR